MTQPICYDLCAGLGGWADGFRAEDYKVIGYDIERHDYGTGGYPALLVLQDILTLHGSELKNAAVIVGSPPCQKYSYMAMPWKQAKALAAWYRESPARVAELNALFDACFRIQREASEAAGRYIPLIVENVKGAQPWVGRARWHFGSFYLWGDVPALMPITTRQAMKGVVAGQNWSRYTETGEGSPHWRMEGLKTQDHLNIRDGHSHTRHLTNPAEHIKNDGGSWFNVAHNTTSGKGRNPVHGTKENGTKFSQSGDAWFDGKPRDKTLGHKGPAAYGSRSNSRKVASAAIAKIPFPLARHIARCFLPVQSPISTSNLQA